MAGRDLFTAPCEGKDLFPEVGETRALASLPRKLSGENKRGLPTPGFCDTPIGWTVRGKILFPTYHRHLGIQRLDGPRATER